MASPRPGGELPYEVQTPRRAFLTSLGATASNPLTIALWTGAFAAAGAATHADSGRSVLLLLVGIGLGSLTWFCMLSTGVSFSRRWLPPRVVKGFDVCAGLGLICFGRLLSYRALHER